MSIQHSLSHYIYLEAKRQHRATDVANVVINFVALFDIPQIMVSDNGTEFCSQLTDELCKTLDIHQVLCAPYHPQSNGQLERAHGVLKDYLSFYCSVEKPESWDLYLHLASSAYNKSVHSSTKHSPHELVFGRPPNLPIDDEDTDEDTSTHAFKLQDRLRYL